MTKFLFTTTLLIVSSLSFSQEDDVIIIDKGEYKSRREKTIRLNDNNRVYKFAPLNLLAGEVTLGYEHKLGVHGSVDMELGATISKISFGFQSHAPDPFVPTINEQSGMGFLIGIGYRYYPLEKTEALNRFYVSPVFRYKLMNHTISDVSGFIPGERKGTKSTANFTFNFGFQRWLSSTFSMDFYAGVGIGHYSEINYRDNQVFQNNEWHFEWLKSQEKYARYVFTIGLKLGIGAK